MKTFLLLFHIFLCLFSLCLGHEYKISIVAITKNDHDHLKEWIDYHLKVGIDHFYIYDNNDHDLTLKLLEPYIEKNIVEYTLWPSAPFGKPFWLNCQPAAYRNCLEKASGHTEWLAIIDTDEYILPMEGTSVREILDKYYSSHHKMYINWKLFGTSYFWGGPGTSILYNLTRCAKPSEPRHLVGKSIVRPETVSNMYDPHYAVSAYPFFNGSGSLWVNQYEDRYLRINHYTFGDEYNFVTYKIPRWLKAEAAGLDLKSAEEGLRKLNDQYCEDECFKMIELLEKLQ